MAIIVALAPPAFNASVKSISKDGDFYWTAH